MVYPGGFHAPVTLMQMQVLFMVPHKELSPVRLVDGLTNSQMPNKTCTLVDKYQNETKTRLYIHHVSYAVRNYLELGYCP